MAYNPLFTFADPALQAQVVNEAQVRAAADAARAQQFAETLRALRQERQANLDREERRAERERVIREGEARGAENKRQFDESLKYNREALGAQTELQKTRQQEADERDIFNNVLNEINRSDGENIPTESEVRAAAHGVGPVKMQALLQRREAKYKSALDNFNIANGEANKINTDKRIGTTDPRTGEKITAEWLMNHNQFKKYLHVDENGVVLPLIQKPRTDATAAAAAPQTPTFHVPIGRPSDTGIESITDIQNRAGSPSLVMRGGQEIGNLLYNSALRGLGQRAGDVLTQQAGGALSGMMPGSEPPPSPGIFSRAADYLRGSVMPSVAEGLNAAQIGPDLRGYFPRESDQPIVSPPLPMPPRRTAQVVIDADTGDILAPPVFAPQY